MAIESDTVYAAAHFDMLKERLGAADMSHLQAIQCTFGRSDSRTPCTRNRNLDELLPLISGRDFADEGLASSCHLLVTFSHERYLIQPAFAIVPGKTKHRCASIAEGQTTLVCCCSNALCMLPDCELC